MPTYQYPGVQTVLIPDQSPAGHEALQYLQTLRDGDTHDVWGTQLHCTLSLPGAVLTLGHGTGLPPAAPPDSGQPPSEHRDDPSPERPGAVWQQHYMRKEKEREGEGGREGGGGREGEGGRGRERGREGGREGEREGEGGTQAVMKAREECGYTSIDMHCTATMLWLSQLQIMM